MKKFIEFEVHEYMDMYPTTRMESMEENDAQEFVNHMNANYSGGTTSLKKVLTKEEALSYVVNTIGDVIEHPTVSGDNLDKVDVDFIKNLIKEFNTCYK
jgi:hypothetical protein